MAEKRDFGELGRVRIRCVWQCLIKELYKDKYQGQERQDELSVALWKAILIDSRCKRLVSFSKGKWVLDAIEHQRKKELDSTLKVSPKSKIEIYNIN